MRIFKNLLDYEEGNPKSVGEGEKTQHFKKLKNSSGVIIAFSFGKSQQYNTKIVQLVRDAKKKFME